MIETTKHKEKKQLVPKLRFKEFDSEWLNCKLGTILEFKNGLNSSKEQYGSGVKFINVLDIINNDFITNDKIIGLVEVTDKEFEKNIVEFGDILFQRSSETREEVGQANVYLDKEYDAVFGGFVIRGKKKVNYDPVFMNFLLKTSSARKEITNKSGGSTRYNVSQEVLSNVYIDTTNLPEQQKIARFLTAIDSKLQQLKTKKTLLDQYKKGLMQQLFSQTLRFRDDDGRDYADWKKDEFGNLANRSKEQYNPSTDNNNYPCIELDCLGQDSGKLLSTYNSLEQKSIKNRFVKGDILFGKLRPYLKKFLKTSFDGVCSTEIWVLQGRLITNDYLYYLIQTYKFNYEVNITSGSKMPRAEWKYISSVTFKYPCNSEQQKIANYLSAIDSKIENINQQIEKTQAFKKGLLQGMFV